MSTPQDSNQPNQPYGQQPQYGQAYPPQQPPKKRRKWPWILLVIVVLIVVGAVMANGGSDDEASVTPGDATTGQGGAEAAQDGGVTWPGKTSDDIGANAGDVVDRDGVVTVASPLEFVASAYSTGAYCSNVSITNNTDENQSFNLLDWSLQDPTGTIRTGTFVIDRPMLSSGETAPGGTSTGAVCFDAPTGNAPGTYVLLFEKTFSFSSDKIGWVNTI